MLEEICPKARSFVPTTSLSMFALSTLEIFNVVDFMDSSDKPYCPHPLQIFPSVPLLCSAAASGTALPCSLGKAMVFTAPALNQSLVLSLRQPEVKYLWGQGRAVSLSGPISAQKQFQTLQLHYNWVCNGCQLCLTLGQSSRPASTQGVHMDTLTSVLRSGRGTVDIFKLIE